VKPEPRGWAALSTCMHYIDLHANAAAKCISGVMPRKAPEEARAHAL